MSRTHTIALVLLGFFWSAPAFPQLRAPLRDFQPGLSLHAPAPGTYRVDPQAAEARFARARGGVTAATLFAEGGTWTEVGRTPDVGLDVLGPRQDLRFARPGPKAGPFGWSLPNRVTVGGLPVSFGRGGVHFPMGKGTFHCRAERNLFICKVSRSWYGDEPHGFVFFLPRWMANFLSGR
jgi:hypothetical protein